MRNSQVNEEYHYAIYGQVPDESPSLAAIKSQSLACALPALSSFVGSPSSLQQGVDCSSSQTYHQQSQFEELAFWQVLQKQQNNMALPGSHHSQLLQQHFRFIEPLKSSHKQHGSMEPPWSHQSQHLNISEHSLKRGGQLSQEVLQANSPTPLESQSHRLFRSGPLIINEEKSAGKLVQDVSQKPQLVASFSTGPYFPGRASYKGKEKVASSSNDMEGWTSAINEPLGLEFSGNRSQTNALYCVSPELQCMHQGLPVSCDITLGREKEDSRCSSLMEFTQALKACSPPGSDIPDPYGHSDGPMFDIPFFTRIPGSSGSSGPVKNSKKLALVYNAKDLHSGKGKEVLNLNKKRRR